MPQRIAFFRIGTTLTGRPRVRVVAVYPLADVLPPQMAVELALERFRRERHLRRWQEAADAYRVG